MKLIFSQKFYNTFENVFSKNYSSMVTDKEITAFIKQRGIKLKGLRRKLKISQQELCKRSGIAQRSISEIENGVHDYKMGTYFKYIKSLR